MATNRTKLSNVKVAEVSIVPRGANKQEFLITKEDEMSGLEEALKKEGLDITLSEQVEKALEPVLKEMKSDKGKLAMKAAMRILNAAKEEVPEEVMQALMAGCGYGYPAPKEAAQDEEGKDKKKYGYPMPMKKEDGSFDFSGVPEEVRPMVEALWKEKSDTEARIKKTEEELAKERDARITKEFQEKASAYKNLGVKTEDLGRVLKDLNEKAPESLKILEPMLKGLDEKAKGSALFAEVGTSASGASSTDGQSWAKIETLAKEIVQKDSKVSKSQAVALVLKQHPELYAQHLQEKRQRA